MKISIMPSEVMCQWKCSTDLLNKVCVWYPQTPGQGNGLDIIESMSKQWRIQDFLKEDSIIIIAREACDNF